MADQRLLIWQVSGGLIGENITLCYQNTQQYILETPFYWHNCIIESDTDRQGQLKDRVTEGIYMPWETACDSGWRRLMHNAVTATRQSDGKCCTKACHTINALLWKCVAKAKQCPGSVSLGQVNAMWHYLTRTGDQWHVMTLIISVWLFFFFCVSQLHVWG